MGRRRSRVMVEEEQPAVNVMWAIIAQLFNREENISYNWHTLLHQNWLQQSIVAIIQAVQDTLKEFLEGEDVVFNVHVEGKNHRCFKCGRKVHKKTVCDSAKNEQPTAQKEQNAKFGFHSYLALNKHQKFPTHTHTPEPTLTKTPTPPISLPT